MDNYNIFGGLVTLVPQTIGDWMTDKIGQQGSDLVSGLVTAAFGFGMVIFLIVGITTLIKMGQEANVQQKKMQKKRAINAFIAAIGLAIAAGTSGIMFLAIPIEFGNIGSSTAVLSTLSHNTIVNSFIHLPLI